jgi:geranylgeranyl diphosphate synthase type II
MKSLKEYRNMVEDALEPTLRSLQGVPERLTEAMLYSLKAGGKRLRPVMLLAACDMAGGDSIKALPFACALEMIHTYSLIHDDLPGMDNDDLRRGKPTSHVVFGEAMAILAGDGLLNSAVEILLRESVRTGSTDALRAAESIVRHAGVGGMIAGQVEDITSEGKRPSSEQVRIIHTHKTADLLQAAMEAGLMLAGCGRDQIEAGNAYGLHFGIAFQIVDDLLDVTGDPALMGKNAGMDDKKMTWVTVRGLEGAREDAAAEVEAAILALAGFGWEHSFFDQLARENLTRCQ